MISVLKRHLSIFLILGFLSVISFSPAMALQSRNQQVESLKVSKSDSLNTQNPTDKNQIKKEPKTPTKKAKPYSSKIYMNIILYMIYKISGSMGA